MKPIGFCGASRGLLACVALPSPSLFLPAVARHQERPPPRCFDAPRKALASPQRFDVLPLCEWEQNSGTDSPLAEAWRVRAPLVPRRLIPFETFCIQFRPAICTLKRNWLRRHIVLEANFSQSQISGNRTHGSGSTLNYHSIFIPKTQPRQHNYLKINFCIPSTPAMPPLLK